jgi:hypothetical protein
VLSSLILNPGEPTAWSGQYEIIGPREGKTAVRRVRTSGS